MSDIKFNFFEDKELNEKMIDSLRGTAGRFAIAIYHICKDKYRYDEETDTFFQFKTHYWENSHELRHYINNDFRKLYNVMYNECKKNIDDTKILKKIDNVYDKIDTTTMKDNILKELKELYLLKKNNLIDLLDSKPYLIGFTNGVYDLQKFEFRNGKYDDYISITCGYDYVAEESKYMDSLMKFLEDIQPDKQQLDYLLTLISTALTGKNIEELFTILTGFGRNGKSKLCELISYTFGNYFASINSKLLTRPRPDSSAPDPLLLSLRKKRIVIASEPEKDDQNKLNCSFIKFITGNDKIELRLCHGNNMITFKGNFVLLLLCNDIPPTDNPDGAYYRRLRCLNFPTEFVDVPTKQHHKLINKNIADKLPYWKQDFMLLLIKYYKKYVTDGLKPTKDIMKYTNKYMEGTDIYMSFIKEKTIADQQHNIKTKILYDHFKVWFKEYFPNRKIPIKNDFLQGASKHIEWSDCIRIDGQVTTGFRNINIVFDE